MQCPSCKEPIDNDSRFCDLCGAQIKICPLCGKPGKGKFCTQDQTELVPAGMQAGSPAAAAPVPVQPAAAPAQPTAAPAAAVPVQPAATPPTPPPVYQPVQQAAAPMPPASGGDTVQFAGNGMQFEARDGDIIGRKAGAFTGIFAAQQHVSGTHCKVLKISGGWHIQDLGSTNGTFVQGARIAPNSPYPLANGVAVRIATIDFTVTFDDGGSTTRV